MPQKGKFTDFGFVAAPKVAEVMIITKSYLGIFYTCVSFRSGI